MYSCHHQQSAFHWFLLGRISIILVEADKLWRRRQLRNRQKMKALLHRFEVGRIARRRQRGLERRFNAISEVILRFLWRFLRYRWLVVISLWWFYHRRRRRWRSPWPSYHWRWIRRANFLIAFASAKGYSLVSLRFDRTKRLERSLLRGRKFGHLIPRLNRILLRKFCW